jgi:hypothetical protein
MAPPKIVAHAFAEVLVAEPASPRRLAARWADVIGLERVEAILYNCLRDGPAAHNRDSHEDFRAHVAGRVAWIEAVNAPRGAKLRAMLDRVDWSR